MEDKCLLSRMFHERSNEITEIVTFATEYFLWNLFSKSCVRNRYM